MADTREAPTGEVVPDVVRQAVLGVAAQVLGSVPPAEVPAALRQVQRFAGRRRATAGAAPLWAALTSDDGFRSRVAAVWSQARPELAERLSAAEPPSAEDLETAVEAAVGAFLTRPDGWQRAIDAVAPMLAARDAQRAGAEREASETGRLDRLENERARLAEQLTAARGDASAARAEIQNLQREARRLRSDADRARHEARTAATKVAASIEEATAVRRAEEADLARLSAEVRAAAAELDATRAVVHGGRELATTRVRLLLDTIVDAASSLRRELALPPSSALPADLVMPDRTAPAAPRTSRGRAAEDPALLEELFSLPRAHLIVDGYNVSKLGYPHLTLAEQRRHLVDALASIATRTGTEVTCCFDGQELGWLPSASSRTVRVLFSAGEIADDLIRRLVRAEPTGRPLIVVSSDREVATDVQAMGAYSVPSATLLTRLSRG